MKFRKIMITCLLILASAALAEAGINTEISGIVSGGGDMGTMYGAGLDLSYNVSSQYGFMYKTYMTAREDTADKYGISADLEYRHMAHMAGIEFYIPASFLERNRLKWKNSICAGYSWTEVSASNSAGKATISDSGYNIYAGTGLQYVFYQHFSPFIDVAYFYSMYDEELKDSNISGYQVSAGIRYSFDSSKSISVEY